ncbi:MAG: hypothetical protein JW891_18970 [Candidatus Lokiarchaeota archaeon]|nr:hypothetical protein [Candidatus Lokiarchaeota archaeon]
MPVVQINFNDIVFDAEVHSFCKNDKYTCPNFGTSWSCPPAAEILEKKIATYDQYFLIYVKIDVNEFRRENSNIEPDKNDDLYQKRLNYLINERANQEISLFLHMLKVKNENIFVLWPEKCRICEKASQECTYRTNQPCKNPKNRHYSMTGAGVNTDSTVKKLNINLEWPPEKYSYRFGLVCVK